MDRSSRQLTYPYRDALLPYGFWKLIVYQADNELRARAFIVTQSFEDLEKLKSKFDVYAKTVQELSRLTGLSFDDRLTTAQYAGLPVGAESSVSRLIKKVDDIDW